jgi:hypothetical protein
MVLCGNKHYLTMPVLKHEDIAFNYPLVSSIYNIYFKDISIIYELKKASHSYFYDEHVRIDLLQS